MTKQTRKQRTNLAAATLTVAVMGRLSASPLDTGDSQYKAGQYGQAAASYQQAVGATHGVEEAKAYYKLGNADHKLQQDSAAQEAYQHAQQIDPSLSFASSPDKFRAALARVGGSAPGDHQFRGMTARRRGASSAGSSELSAAYEALGTQNVYVAPGVQGVSQDALEQAATGSQSDGATVKIAVLSSLSQAAPVGQVAAEMHHRLNLGKEGLVVVALSGAGNGVAVATTQLSQPENEALAQQYVGQIKSDPTAGTAALAQAVSARINGSINNGKHKVTSLVTIFFLIVVVGIVLLLLSATRRRKADLVSAKQPVDALRANVLSGIEYLDNYIDVLPKNNPDSDQVRLFRQSADAKYEQAIKILDAPMQQPDLLRAQGLLDRAQADVQQARRYLDRATGGTDKIPGDDALRPPPLPETQKQVEAIPANQRGVSFFSSQPAPLGSLVPVTVTIGGQSRQVLATPEEADELRQGRMPQVRVFQENGRYVPWYEYGGYNPYNDYWRYENSGWGGFGNGIVAGMIGAELVDDLFAPRGFGYGGMGFGSPYAFSTDNDYYQGYYDGQQNSAYASSFGGDPGFGGGGIGGPGYDTQDYNYDNSGSASFGNDSSGYGSGDRS